MRLNISASLFVASSLFCLGSSLPFFPRKAALEPRATYSVVPVDGGSSATTNTAGQGEVTIVKTIIETPSPTTQTIIKTDTLPGTTDTIISTETVEGPKETQTIDRTLTPSASPTTVTATEYSVINISVPTTIVLPPTRTATATATPTQTSSGAAKSTTSNANSTHDTTSLLVSKASSTPEPSSPAATTNTPSTLETSYTSTFTPLITSSPVSAGSYDNGQWHTTYPTWSNGTATLRTAATPVHSASSLPVDLTNRSEEFGVINTVLRFIRRFSSS